jgi:F0F1-type ATP synthase assembly protein I
MIAGVNTRFKSMQFDYKKHQPWAEHLSIVMQIGLTMAGCIIFCFFIGLALDKWIGTRGIFVAIFTVLGVIGGAVTVYRQIIEITEEKKDHREDDNNS